MKLTYPHFGQLLKHPLKSGFHLPQIFPRVVGRPLIRSNEKIERLCLRNLLYAHGRYLLLIRLDAREKCACPHKLPLPVKRHGIAFVPHRNRAGAILRAGNRDFVKQMEKGDTLCASYVDRGRHSCSGHDRGRLARFGQGRETLCRRARAPFDELFVCQYSSLSARLAPICCGHAYICGRRATTSRAPDWTLICVTL